jgi:hypothetical protein
VVAAGAVGMSDIVLHRSTGTFDYSALDADTADLARQAAERIRGHHRAVTEIIIRIGVDLIGVKERLKKSVGYGQFERWIDAEFGMTIRTAQNYMNAAAAFEGKSETVSYLPSRTVYALSSRSVPAAIRNEVVSRSERGDRLPVSDINDMVANARSRARMGRAEAKRTAGRRASRAAAKAHLERERAGAAQEREERIAADRVAMGRAIAWVKERGNPAELLALLDEVFYEDFVSALRRAVNGQNIIDDPRPAFLQGPTP